MVEAKNLPGKKSRDKIQKKNTGLVKKSSSLFMDLSSPNLLHLEKGFEWKLVLTLVTADPYAEVNLGRQRSRTRIINQKLNPFWCEEFSL